MNSVPIIDIINPVNSLHSNARSRREHNDWIIEQIADILDFSSKTDHELLKEENFKLELILVKTRTLIIEIKKNNSTNISVNEYNIHDKKYKKIKVKLYSDTFEHGIKLLGLIKDMYQCEYYTKTLGRKILLDKKLDAIEDFFHIIPFETTCVFNENYSTTIDRIEYGIEFLERFINKNKLNTLTG
jgi:hypothetical protein